MRILFSVLTVFHTFSLPYFPLLHFPPVRSTPAFFTLEIYSYFFHSCIFRALLWALNACPGARPLSGSLFRFKMLIEEQNLPYFQWFASCSLTSINLVKIEVTGILVHLRVENDNINVECSTPTLPQSMGDDWTCVFIIRSHWRSSTFANTNRKPFTGCALRVVDWCRWPQMGSYDPIRSDSTEMFRVAKISPIMQQQSATASDLSHPSSDDNRPHSRR